MFQQAGSLPSDVIENEYIAFFPLDTVNSFQLQLFRLFMKSLETLFPKHQPTEWGKILTNPTSDRG